MPVRLRTIDESKTPLERPKGLPGSRAGRSGACGLPRRGRRTSPCQGAAIRPCLELTPRFVEWRFFDLVLSLQGRFEKSLNLEWTVVEAVLQGFPEAARSNLMSIRLEIVLIKLEPISHPFSAGYSKNAVPPTGKG